MIAGATGKWQDKADETQHLKEMTTKHSHSPGISGELLPLWRSGVAQLLLSPQTSPTVTQHRDPVEIIPLRRHCQLRL